MCWTASSPASGVERLRGKAIHVVEKFGFVRISPHFYNTTEEIDRFADALAAEVRPALRRG